MRLILRLMALAAALAGPPAAAGEDFTIPEADAKPCTLGGRLELRHLYHRLDSDSARYRLDNYQDAPGAGTHEWRALAELSAGCRQGMWQANVLSHHELSRTYEAESDTDNKLYELYATLTPTVHLSVDAGKKLILWGKGYAWNPAGFVNRQRDPDDPALSLEGRALLGVDLIKSLAAGGLSNVGLTALLLPVIGDWANPELGEDGDIVAALKLYLLWHDTDIDLIYFDGPAQPRSLGFDFSRNLAENIEVHGELAWRQDVPRAVIDAAGRLRRSRRDQMGWLVGLRYLNAYETTFIAEYYHNGAGYDRREVKDFFAFQQTAYERWLESGDPASMQRADAVSRPYYRQRNFSEDYLYVKASQKEPFGILYLTPWLATVVNLQDFSFNLQPGATWTPVTDLELNFRLAIPVGPDATEFGEKPDAIRSEFWVRYYF